MEAGGIKLMLGVGTVQTTKERQDPSRVHGLWDILGSVTQHWASMVFISSSRLLSSVASLHFPSTDTELSPFFTSRQT